MIEKKTLLPGVTLRCCRDHRFKQGCLSFQLVRPMCREEAGMNGLLPSVLLRGTRQHPDLRSITEQLDTLYGAAVSAQVRRVGDYQTTGLYCGFMEDRFAMAGDRILEPMIRFLGELLLDSPLTEEGFLPEVVESEKKNLIAAIEADRNDKRVYAMGQLLKRMCCRDSFGIPRLGEPEQVEAITPRRLYAHYQRILRESPIEIFYVGSAEPETVARLLQAVLEPIPRQPRTLPAQTVFADPPAGAHSEILDVTQGKLCMGFTTEISNTDPRFAAMQVANMLFGGGATSKLFMNVREKHSLCYSISSGYYGSKGILTVDAGIEFDKMEQTRQEILEQLKACGAGQITEEELEGARQAILSSLRSSSDSPGSIASYYGTMALSGMPMEPEAYMEAVRSVTREQAAAAAATLKLHTEYFLRGAE